MPMMTLGFGQPNMKFKHDSAKTTIRMMNTILTLPVSPRRRRRVMTPPTKVPMTVGASFSIPEKKEIRRKYKPRSGKTGLQEFS
ncbi:hypothetical protein DPMN_068500 [Dreissena polymorpha]|uniref:Uncharacterized protein n=1 Tax=Dreissena polymorpha TaxID=45954 RepID=A0A9D4BTN3_DREPO|nr:hypothetical protein DPMN_068500 [Dreissena polymorpha]